MFWRATSTCLIQREKVIIITLGQTKMSVKVESHSLTDTIPCATYSNKNCPTWNIFFFLSLDRSHALQALNVTLFRLLLWSILNFKFFSVSFHQEEDEDLFHPLVFSSLAAGWLLNSAPHSLENIFWQGIRCAFRCSGSNTRAARARWLTRWTVWTIFLSLHLPSSSVPFNSSFQRGTTLQIFLRKNGWTSWGKTSIILTKPGDCTIKLYDFLF